MAKRAIYHSRNQVAITQVDSHNVYAYGPVPHLVALIDLQNIVVFVTPEVTYLLPLKHGGTRVSRAKMNAGRAKTVGKG